MLPLDAGPCQIRAWRPGDRAALVRHANNRKVWRMLRDQFPHPYTTADADAWIAVADAQNPLTSFAIVADGAAVGGIGIVLHTDIHRRTAELGYWVGEAFWNRGIATGFLSAVLLRFDASVTVAMLFIAAMVTFFVGLVLFLREIFVATANLRIGPR